MQFSLNLDFQRRRRWHPAIYSPSNRRRTNWGEGAAAPWVVAESGKAIIFSGRC